MLQSTTWGNLKKIYFNISILNLHSILIYMLAFLNFILTIRKSIFESKFLMRVRHISLYFQQHSANWLNSVSLDFKRLGVTAV